MEYKFTFEDGSSGYLSHYGVKGMKKGKHIKAKDEDYLRSLGMLGSTISNKIENPLDGALATARDKLSTLPHVDNPLYKLKQKSDQMAANGQNAAARQRLMDRYAKGNTPQVQAEAEKAKAAKEKSSPKSTIKEKTGNGKKDFDARDYGFEDNSAWSRKATRGEYFGRLAEKRKMSREKAIQMENETHKKSKDWFKDRTLMRPDGSHMTKMETQKVLADQHKKGLALANTFKPKKQLNAELKKKNAYLAETRTNKGEFAGDDKGLKEAQRRTDAFYGRKGKEAQRVEAQRRRRASDKLESMLKKDGMARGSDGVWRKSNKSNKRAS